MLRKFFTYNYNFHFSEKNIVQIQCTYGTFIASMLYRMYSNIYSKQQYCPKTQVPIMTVVAI